MPRALITGIYGQDGILLSQLLTQKGYSVLGIVQDINSEKDLLLSKFSSSLKTIKLNLLSHQAIKDCIDSYKIDEIYNLAGISSIARCERDPDLAIVVNSGIPSILLRILVDTKIKIYQASSSEIFGKDSNKKQSEDTPLSPRNIYGLSKVAPHLMVRHFREELGVFASAGILYNHESEFRGSEYVSSRIIDNLLRIKYTSDRSRFTLGDLNSRRDWGYASEYVEAMWLMLQSSKPSEYIVATGVTYSVGDFMTMVLRELDMDLDIQQYIEVDEGLFRNEDEAILCGDATRIKNELGWKPTYTLEETIREIVSRKRELYL